MLKYFPSFYNFTGFDELFLFWEYQNSLGYVVELGVYHGHSLYEFCQIYENERIIGIDNFSWHSEEYHHPKPTLNSVQRNLLLHGYNPRILETSSLTPPEWVNDVGVLFVDTCHTRRHLKKEMAVWLPRLRKDAFLFFHDYERFHNRGYPQTIDEIMEENNWFKLDQADQMVVFSKKGLKDAKRIYAC